MNYNITISSAYKYFTINCFYFFFVSQDHLLMYRLNWRFIEYSSPITIPRIMTIPGERKIKMSNENNNQSQRRFCLRS